MLGIGPQKPRETLCWGSVTAASGDALTVNVKGQEAVAVKCCNASVGDVVALECLGGTYRAIGRRGGELTLSGEWATAYALPAAYQLQQSTNGTELPTLQFVNLTGNSSDITLSDGSIVCPRPGSVLAVAHVALGTSGFTANDIIHLRIQRNGANTGADLVERKVSTGYGTMQLVTVVSVAAGDVISAKAWNQTAARGTVQNSSSTRITVAYL